MIGLLLTLCLAAPGGETAQEKAKAAYAEGIAAFKGKAYKTAREKLEYAYMLDPSPNLLFNLGRVSEEMGDFDKAIHYFQLYLDRHPDAPDADVVRGKIEGIKTVQKFRDQQAPPVEPDPPPASKPVEPDPPPASEPVEPEPTSAPVAPPAEGRPMRTGGWIAVGLAGALAVGAVALDVHTSGEIDDYKAAANSGDAETYDRLKDEIPTKQTLTQVLYGAALVSGGVGGALLYLDHKAQKRVSLAPGPGGLVLFGTF